MTVVLVTNVVAWSAQVAAIVIACAPLPRLLRLPAHVQYGFWRVVLAVCLALPLLQPWHTVVAGLETVAPITVAAAAPIFIFHPRAGGAPVNWAEWAMIALAAGIVLRLAWVVLGSLTLRRMRTMGEPVSGETSADVRDLASTIGARAAVRWIPGLRQPATFGLRRPMVLLPDTLREQPETVRQAVIAHELLHVQRRDAAMVLIEEVVRAVTWFHPAMWWLVSRVRLAREGVVDELTVMVTGARQTYLDALLLLADEAPLASSAFSRRRQLFYRVVLISREVRMTSGRFVAASAVLALALVATTWTAASAFPLQKVEQATAAQNPTPPPAPARDIYRNPPPPPPPPPPKIAWQSPDGADAIHIGGQIKTPTKIRDVKPEYPAAAQAAGVQGVVIISALLDREGSVEEVHVLRSIPLLDQAAVDAVSQWKFTPVLLNGAAVPVIMTVTVNFTQGQNVPPQAGWQSPDAAKALRIGANIKTPERIHDVKPVYPDAARVAGVKGVVIVEALLDRLGNIEEVHVLRSIPMLDAAAVDAVSQWKFTPVLLNGQPMPAIMTLTVNFNGE
jgi:TonB family protein